MTPRAGLPPEGFLTIKNSLTPSSSREGALGEAAPRSRALPAPGHQLLSGYTSHNSTLLLLAGLRDRKTRQRKLQSSDITQRGVG